MITSELFRRLIPILEGCGIPYMVTGSLASSVHGTPRSTQDIDMVIDADRAGLSRFVRALPADQYYVSEDSALRALATGGQFNVIDYQTGWKIDFILRKKRPFSASEFDRRSVEIVDGLSLVLVSPEDSLLSKLEWAKEGGSERQLMDAAGILQSQLQTLDEEYLEYWAEELGVTAELRRSRSLASSGM